MTKKLKFENVNDVLVNFCGIAGWIDVKKKKMDLKCQQCGRLYADILESGEDTKLALASPVGLLNKHMCNVCGRRYIDETGAKDCYKIRQDLKAEKDSLIEEIVELSGGKVNNRYMESLQDKASDSLKAIVNKLTIEKVERGRLAAITISKEDAVMEDYLVKEYGVIQDVEYLKDISQIEEYFEDEYYDYFDCGQGYFQDEAVVLVKIRSKFYEVTLTAEIVSAKQDRGDRLYWAESLESVTYKEIPKPVQKEVVTRTYTVTADIDTIKAVDRLMKPYMEGV